MDMHLCREDRTTTIIHCCFDKEWVVTVLVKGGRDGKYGNADFGV